MPPTTTRVDPAAGTVSRSGGERQKTKFLLIVFSSVLLAALASHIVAAMFGLHLGTAAYRRIGPTNGPQVFCAGSSLLQFGLAWPAVSVAFGQGIENWGVGGSSPEVWEVSQRLATNANAMIIGVSVYDLNEQHLCDSRAHIVPLGQTIEDLWQAGTGWQFSKLVLSQYPLAYLRSLFPTAGRSDAVLVGLRRNVRVLAGLEPSAEDKGNSLVLPSQPVLDFGDSTEKLSDWPRDKAERRLGMQRNEIQGSHEFDGPKRLAFLRMLHRAEAGRTIVVVMPVSPTYTQEFLTPEVLQRFEAVLSDAQRSDPHALFVRLDQFPALSSDEYFSDFVHLNGAGREIATGEFLKVFGQHSARP